MSIAVVKQKCKPVIETLRGPSESLENFNIKSKQMNQFHFDMNQNCLNIHQNTFDMLERNQV